MFLVTLLRVSRNVMVASFEDFSERSMGSFVRHLVGIGFCLLVGEHLCAQNEGRFFSGSNNPGE